MVAGFDKAFAARLRKLLTFIKVCIHTSRERLSGNQ